MPWGRFLWPSALLLAACVGEHGARKDSKHDASAIDTSADTADTAGDSGGDTAAERRCPDEPWAEVAPGFFAGCGITVSGCLECWALYDPGISGVPDPVLDAPEGVMRDLHLRSGFGDGWTDYGPNSACAAGEDDLLQCWGTHEINVEGVQGRAFDAFSIVGSSRAGTATGFGVVYSYGRTSYPAVRELPGVYPDSIIALEQHACYVADGVLSCIESEPEFDCTFPFDATGLHLFPSSTVLFAIDAQGAVLNAVYSWACGIEPILEQHLPARTSGAPWTSVYSGVDVMDVDGYVYDMDCVECGPLYPEPFKSYGVGGKYYRCGITFDGYAVCWGAEGYMDEFPPPGSYVRHWE